MPDRGPLGETFLQARVLAIVTALFLNSPEGRWVESVVTVATHRLPVFLARFTLAAGDGAWHWSRKRHARPGQPAVHPGGWRGHPARRFQRASSPGLEPAAGAPAVFACFPRRLRSARPRRRI